jgi:hypothetical protein
MSKFINIIGLISVIYFITSQISALYFLYLWSNEHGFISTITFGVIVAEIKGLFFPFFI